MEADAGRAGAVQEDARQDHHVAELRRARGERKQTDAIQADFRARHKAIDGSDALARRRGQQLDDGLNANERSLKSEMKQEQDAKKAKDVELDETAHILFDAVGMIKADPKLATEVLPYGGKFSGAYMASLAAPAKPATSPAPPVPVAAH